MQHVVAKLSFKDHVCKFLASFPQKFLEEKKKHVHACIHFSSTNVIHADDSLSSCQKNSFLIPNVHLCVSLSLYIYILLQVYDKEMGDDHAGKRHKQMKSSPISSTLKKSILAIIGVTWKAFSLGWKCSEWFSECCFECTELMPFYITFVVHSNFGIFSC